MRVLIIADRPFAAHERDMLTRVQVGLIDEGVRVIEALPTDVADPDANPLIPTIAYSDQTALLASRAPNALRPGPPMSLRGPVRPRNRRPTPG